VIGDIARVGDGAQRMLQRARRGAEHGVLAVGFCHGGLFQRHQLKQAGPYSVGQRQRLGRMLQPNSVEPRLCDSTDGPFALGHLKRGLAWRRPLRPSALYFLERVRLKGDGLAPFEGVASVRCSRLLFRRRSGASLTDRLLMAHGSDVLFGSMRAEITAPSPL
jgi:hypothetical protein